MNIKKKPIKTFINRYIGIFTVFAMMFVGISILPNQTMAKTNTTVSELEEIISSLMQQVERLQLQLSNLSEGTSSHNKVSIIRRQNYDNHIQEIFINLGRGMSDKRGVRGSVSHLQQCLTKLGYYDEEITGFFGPVTESAVKRFQAQNGIVSSGSPWITGYGNVGPKTRAYINKLCKRDLGKESDVTIPPKSFVKNKLSAKPRYGSAPLKVVFDSDEIEESWFGGVVIDYGDDTSAQWIFPGSIKQVKNSRVHVYKKPGKYKAKLIGKGEDDSKLLGRAIIKVFDAGMCTSHGQSFPEGTEKTSIVDEDGIHRGISDGHFVCQDGKWEIEGSLPSEGDVLGASTTIDEIQLFNILSSLEEYLRELSIQIR